MGKPEGWLAAMPAKPLTAARPGINDGLHWLTIQKLPDGKWHVLELVNGAARTVDSAYYRDLIEQAAAKHMRRLGR